MTVHRSEDHFMCSVDAINNFFSTPEYLTRVELTALLGRRIIRKKNGVTVIRGMPACFFLA